MILAGQILPPVLNSNFISQIRLKLDSGPAQAWRLLFGHGLLGKEQIRFTLGQGHSERAICFGKALKGNNKGWPLEAV